MDAGAYGLVDTGPAGILVPQHVLREINKALGHPRRSGNSFFVDCSEVPSMRTIYIHMGGGRLALEPNDYITKVSVWN